MKGGMAGAKGKVVPPFINAGRGRQAQSCRSSARNRARIKKELASVRGNGHDRRIPMNLIAVSPQCVLSSLIAAKANTGVHLQTAQGRWFPRTSKARFFAPRKISFKQASGGSRNEK
jgi:hypothetical protein